MARDRLLIAARSHLAAGDYDRTSARALAAEAGVSHSLVNFHFGSRAGLTTAALSVHRGPHDVVASAQNAAGQVDIEHLVDAMIALWEDESQRPRLVALARQAAAGGPTSSVVADYIDSEVGALIVERLGVERARRLLLAFAGVVFGRYVVGIPSLARVERSELRRTLLTMAGVSGNRDAQR